MDLRHFWKDHKFALIIFIEIIDFTFYFYYLGTQAGFSFAVSFLMEFMIVIRKWKRGREIKYIRINKKK